MIKKGFFLSAACSILVVTEQALQGSVGNHQEGRWQK